jgi:hypothetical protein
MEDVAIFYGHLVYFCRFGMLNQEKSGNPALYALCGQHPLLLIGQQKHKKLLGNISL